MFCTDVELDVRFSFQKPCETDSAAVFIVFHAASSQRMTFSIKNPIEVDSIDG